MPVLRLVACGLVAAIACVAPAWAQQPTDSIPSGRQQEARDRPAEVGFSSLTGTVSDRLGGQMSGVTVTLTHSESGARRTTTTAPDGTFELANLPGGGYALLLSREGFARTYLGLELDDNERATQTMTMQVDSVVDTVRVVSGTRSAGSLLTPVRPSTPRPASSGDRICSADGSGCVVPARKVSGPGPQYPVSARDRGVEGVVIAEATIDEQGSISDVRLLRSVDEQLDTAVMEAVRQWQYLPTTLNGAPMASLLNLTVEFVFAGR